MSRNNKNRGNNNASKAGKSTNINTNSRGANSSTPKHGTNSKTSYNTNVPEKTGPNGKSDDTSDRINDAKEDTGGGTSNDGKENKRPRPNNDFEWYNSDPYATESVARVPFSEALGDFINSVSSKSGLQFVNNNANQSIVSSVTYNVDGSRKTAEPGIMVLRSLPYYGRNTKITDPLNLAATEIYTMVRKSNNGRKNYDPSDLMMYVLSISELYAYLFWIERMYGLCYMYSQRNKYIGKELIRAAGGAADSLLTNLANFRYWINIFINRMAAYAIPSNIALFARRAFMYANIYTESDTGNIKDQLYMFAPAGFYKFGLDAKGRGMLDMVHIDQYPKTLSDIMQIGDSLFENINQDEDFALMSGDIFKAYEGNIMTLAEMPEAYAILPVYEHEVLTQMKNATVCGFAETAAFNSDWYTYYAPLADNGTISTERFNSGRVYQNDKGILFSNIVYPLDGFDNMEVSDSTTMVSLPILSTDIESPQTADVMEMTRLIVRAEDFDGGIFVGPNVDPTDATKSHPGMVLIGGSDIVVTVEVLVNDYLANQHESGSNISRYSYKHPGLDVVDSNTVAATLSMLLEMVKLKSFKFAPVMYMFETLVDGSTRTVYSRDMFGDLQNYGLVSLDQLKRIHSVALFSLCHVPGIAINLSTK